MITKMNNMYCELYVNSLHSRDGLSDAIQAVAQGTFDGCYIDCDWGSLYVRKNNEYSPLKARGESGFLYYRYVVEINTIDNAGTTSAYVDGIRNLISRLRYLNALVVAACDFEDQLDSVP
jgi:hypothetical protein